MASDEATVCRAMKGLAPKNKRGPHSQFVKGYNRALRDVMAALDTAAAETRDDPADLPRR